MTESSPPSARPVVGDVLSFNTDPERPEDVIELTIAWQQDFQARSAKYMFFKARNVSTSDVESLVPVFVQSNYYPNLLNGKTGTIEFPITTDWQYGPQPDTENRRFVVLHDKRNQPYQRRFMASKAIQTANLIVEGAAAEGHPGPMNVADEAEKWLPGEYLLSYTSST